MTANVATTLLFRQEDALSSAAVADVRDLAEEKAARGLFCRKCSRYITSPDNSMEVNGAHRHTFFNPAGIVYEIGCFSDAAGCLLYGPPSAEFSWFAGYTWRLSLCACCTTHLGWFFSSGDTTFYGLITKNLTSS